jgi:O-antigen biosynthesis protein
MQFNVLDHPVALLEPRRMSAVTFWTMHIPFAMTLIDLLRPRTIVELGVHLGDSHCGFCQAVEALKLPTRCFGVDLWEGDPHTGFYGPDVLADLRAHHDPLYGSFSTLLRMDFDAALSRFDDHAIDLIHIDGYHTYEAVRHDFDSWLPKMSDRGVMIFHDTTVHERDFGVWRFWEETAPRYPSFLFEHGAGLGVLAVGAGFTQPNDPETAPLRNFLDEANREPALMRHLFWVLGQSQERRRLLTQLLLRTLDANSDPTLPDLARSNPVACARQVLRDSLPLRPHAGASIPWVTSGGKSGKKTIGKSGGKANPSRADLATRP